jgi:hypothetical protein
MVNKNKLKSPNREYVRVTMASRLMAGYYNIHGMNLRGSSVIGCGRWRAYGRDTSEAEIRIDQDGARLEGHFKCGNVWTCDHCARARVAQARSWIRAALIPALEANNLGASMMTFTMAHTYDGNWKESIDKLHDAYKTFDKNMSKHYKIIGSIGKLKSLEAPIGVNGIHGHFHVLVTHTKNASLTTFEILARREWGKAVSKISGHCNEHGFDLKLNAMADYLAKQELSHEMSNHDTKQARKKGLLLNQLLDKAARGDKKSSAEWIRAVEALQGRSRFHAGDIASKLGIPTCTEWKDEERKIEILEYKSVLPEPNFIRYSIHKHMKATAVDHPRFGLAIILRVARRGNADKVLAIVDKLCCEYENYKLRSNCSKSVELENRLIVNIGRDIEFE